MNGNTFNLSVFIGIWEAEMIIKALEAYTPENGEERLSKPSLIDLIQYQINKAKEVK